MMMMYNIVNLKENESLQKEAAKWFASKWNINEKIYLESFMNKEDIPSWFVVLDDEKIKLYGKEICTS